MAHQESRQGRVSWTWVIVMIRLGSNRFRCLGLAIKLVSFSLTTLTRITEPLLSTLQLRKTAASVSRIVAYPQDHFQPQSCIPKSFSVNSFFPLWDGGYVFPIPFAKASYLTHPQSHSLESDPPAFFFSLHQLSGSKSDS